MSDNGCAIKVGDRLAHKAVGRAKEVGTVTAAEATRVGQWRVFLTFEAPTKTPGIGRSLLVDVNGKSLIPQSIITRLDAD